MAIGRTLRAAARRTPLRRVTTWRRHRGLSEHDLFVASYPKSGNTWIRFLLADLVTHRDIDFADAEVLAPVVGRHEHAPAALSGGGRVIKTHEPFRREYRRAVYIVRDVRDVALSYERFITGYGIRYDNREAFLRDFVRGSLDGYGTWMQHVTSWMQHGSSAEVLVIRYEHLRRDPLAGLRAVTDHAGLRCDDARLRQAVERNTLAAMSAKEQRSRRFVTEQLGWDGDFRFVGDGAVGGWRHELSAVDLEILAPALRFQEGLDKQRGGATAAVQADATTARARAAG